MITLDISFRGDRISGGFFFKQSGQRAVEQQFIQRWNHSERDQCAQRQAPNDGDGHTRPEWAAEQQQGH